MIDNQLIQSYLDYYGLKLIDYRSLGKVIKVKTNEGFFCIKRVSNRVDIAFVQKIKNLYKQGYRQIVPLYVTKEQKYGVVIYGELWYLTPWFTREAPADYGKHQTNMLYELACIHSMTVKNVSISPKDRDSYYKNMNEQIEKQKNYLRLFLQTAEKKVMMSPFEWQYCMYYSDIEQALEFSRKKLEIWYEKVQNDVETRVVLTHGKFSEDHFILSEDGKGYFISMENVAETAPYFDILPFFVKKLHGVPKEREDLVEVFQSYLNVFGWTEVEMLLFMSYISYPEGCLRSVDEYYTNKDSLPEIEHCRQILLRYWLMKNTEYFVMRIEKYDGENQ